MELSPGKKVEFNFAESPSDWHEGHLVAREDEKTHNSPWKLKMSEGDDISPNKRHPSQRRGNREIFIGGCSG